jgi:putative hydrolase of the HAD superfamily
VVICDFGGVLTTPLSDAFAAYGRRSGIGPEELRTAMAAATEAAGGRHPLFELERGEITEAEFLARLEAHLGGRLLDDFREAYFAALEPNAPMIGALLALRERGARTALLTNNVREWEPLWRAKLPPLDELFEVVVDSAFVGMRKPEPEIYELTLERLGGVPADRCVFVDDLGPNCAAAADLGMHAVRFVHAEQAIAEVEAALTLGRSKVRPDRPAGPAAHSAT